ncbi:MAG: 2TM domain-containing protein [Bacteroidia bacterium]|nr:2TM domain-containing protein [Bacteroidia bacterium]
MEQKDENLWRIAKKRASFKRHLFSYVVINLFLYAIWYFTHGYNDEVHGFPWPVWVTLGWGIGIAFNYYEAYHSYRDTSVEREYEKLKREQQNKSGQV